MLLKIPERRFFGTAGSVIRGSTTSSRTRAEKHRKGGNKSVATNMSVARLFIDQEGHDVTLACTWPGHCFEGKTRCSLACPAIGSM